MREASHHSKELLQTLADITSKIVEWIINLAPLGILGLVYTTISGKGFQALKSYGILLLALIDMSDVLQKMQRFLEEI